MARAKRFEWAACELVVLALLCIVGYSILKQADQSLETRIAAAKTDFGFRLFGEVQKNAPDRNVSLSPAGIEMGLALAYNGASGQTRDAMASALGLEDVLLEDLNAAQRTLKAVLEKPDKNVQLLIANSLWAREDILFEPEFIRRTQDYYQAEVRNLDLDAPQAVPTIDAWVARSTRGRIVHIADSPLPAGAPLYLINAVAFKAPWARAFPREATRDGDFATGGGENKKWPMMRRSGRFEYFRGEEFQAANLPYAGGRLSMYLFLPDPGMLLTTFCGGMDSETWEMYLSQFDEEEGLIVLPRFRIECGLLLDEPLKALGMGSIFQNAADFGAMTPEKPAWISRIKHKTYAEVDETGSRASSDRTGGGKEISQPGSGAFSMIVDRPFFFVIRDNTTGHILFLGAVVDPTL